MVAFSTFLGATLLAGVVSALPRPDSSSGDEVAVSAPNGVILSDTAALASQSSAAAASASAYPASVTSSSYASSASASASSAANGYGYSSMNNGYGYNSASSGSGYSSMSNGYGYSSASSSAYVASATYSAPPSSMTYGSGYSNWGGQGYDSCVSQCIASYGAPPATYTPPPYSGSQSSSNNHTVIVAPMQGVLRFVPAFVNASVGDNIHFVWMANNHTVTKSSALLPCNKTADQPFASGTQNKGFTFDQIVNDTNPTFFYCGTPGHCEAGMFGAINPSVAQSGSNTSVNSMMPMMVSNDSSLSAMWSYMNSTATQYNASTSAMNWGQNYDVMAIPSWARGQMMDNVMYTRMFLAMNPEVMGADGKIDMTGTQAPIKFPNDMSNAMQILNNDASGSASTPASSTAAPSQSSAASSSSASATPSKTPNGARGTVVSSAFVGIAVLAVSMLAL